jgi:hypothetical protein
MIDIGSAERFRKQLDELYEILRDEDSYRAPRLVDALRRLPAEVGRPAAPAASMR